MPRPQTDQIVDIDLFSNIYDSVNSLNTNEVQYVLDNIAEPWNANKTKHNQVAAAGQLKIVAGYYGVHDSAKKKHTGARHFQINFPASAGFTTTPVVVCNAASLAGSTAAEPAALSIDKVDSKGFLVQAQSIDNHGISITTISYIAIGT
jgi:hypothetical protein